jgi:hypothetical protein
MSTIGRLSLLSLAPFLFPTTFSTSLHFPPNLAHSMNPILERRRQLPADGVAHKSTTRKIIDCYEQLKEREREREREQSLSPTQCISNRTDSAVVVMFIIYCRHYNKRLDLINAFPVHIVLKSLENLPFGQCADNNVLSDGGDSL